jgi:hypothetical protein
LGDQITLSAWEPVSSVAPIGGDIGLFPTLEVGNAISIRERYPVFFLIFILREHRCVGIYGVLWR